LSARLEPALEKTLERRLRSEQTGLVRFDVFTRGRYATDASHYQVMPLGVVAPHSMEDAERILAVCRSEGVAVTPRGGGTSQAGQTVNHAIILDCSQHLDRIIEIDPAGRR
jgi:FAD/FMN-containing dehydrogenase